MHVIRQCGTYAHLRASRSLTRLLLGAAASDCESFLPRATASLNLRKIGFLAPQFTFAVRRASETENLELDARAFQNRAFKFIRYKPACLTPTALRLALQRMSWVRSCLSQDLFAPATYPNAIFCSMKVTSTPCHRSLAVYSCTLHGVAMGMLVPVGHYHPDWNRSSIRCKGKSLARRTSPPFSRMQGCRICIRPVGFTGQDYCPAVHVPEVALGLLELGWHCGG
jgi:hypothetical protein